MNLRKIQRFKCPQQSYRLSNLMVDDDEAGENEQLQAHINAINEVINSFNQIKHVAEFIQRSTYQHPKGFQIENDKYKSFKDSFSFIIQYQNQSDLISRDFFKNYNALYLEDFRNTHIKFIDELTVFQGMFKTHIFLQKAEKSTFICHIPKIDEFTQKFEEIHELFKKICAYYYMMIDSKARNLIETRNDKILEDKKKKAINSFDTDSIEKEIEKVIDRRIQIEKAITKVQVLVHVLTQVGLV